MAKVYEYVCKKCGARAELNYGKEGTRHMIQDPTWTAPRLIVCGTFRRAWSSVSFNRVPGGGRA